VLPARGFDALSHAAVEVVGARLVDQGHGALGQAVGDEEGFVGRRDHVDDGVSDGGDVVGS
jgi:hypothetical protein